jgi:hypothetical protein
MLQLKMISVMLAFGGLVRTVNDLPTTTLEYRVWRPVGAPRRGDAVLQIKGIVAMANYRFRANMERLGVNSGTLTTRIEWPEATPEECHFVIEAPATGEILSLAFGNAVRAVGLQAKRI